MANHPNRSRAPKHCAFCGKPAVKVTEKIYNPHWMGNPSKDKPTDSTAETWTYTGNLQVVKREINNFNLNGGNKTGRKWLAWVSVWDGETWSLAYDPFCTLGCAESFAKAAYRAGYRMPPKLKAPA